MDVFNECSKINNLIISGHERLARDQVIKLLAEIETDKEHCPPLLNHLIRRVGLYPYIDPNSSDWNEQLVYEAFKVDVGGTQDLTLHREQSHLLKRLLNGESIAVSAPTSFGKSFVIDAFISITRPTNVAIIVPTIALTDETRRRLFKKFGHTYKFITTSDVEVGDRNIFIFPQERAISYINSIDVLDILIIDEFYKASKDYDKERSTPLLKAILKLGARSKQRYFLAPNISTLKQSPFTQGMEFVPLDMNTVYLSKFHWKNRIDLSEENKNEITRRRLSKRAEKSLVYIGTYAAIDRVSNFLIGKMPPIEHDLCQQFSSWLSKNYHKNWILVELAKRGIGVHTGRLHRSLSQIQVKLFEEELGLNGILSTSSIIEGVNTSAKNVIIWQNRNGPSKLNDFTYKNIIGRSGRMFRHFVGHVDILDEAPEEEEAQLNLIFPDDLLADVDQEKYSKELTPEQVAAIIEYKNSMENYLGADPFNELQNTNALVSSDYKFLQKLAASMKETPLDWSGLRHLRVPEPKYWDNILFRLLKFKGGNWETDHTRFVRFVKLLSNNWRLSIPQLLDIASRDNHTVDDFFRLERKVSFALSSLLRDVNTIQMAVVGNPAWDVSGFVHRVSNAFLPAIVYQLEEYGLPRMLSRRIQDAGVINFEEEGATLHSVLEQFNNLGRAGLVNCVEGLSDFDKYIIDFFIDGITVDGKPIEQS